VDEERRMRSGHRLRLVLCGPFTALTLMVGWQEGPPVHDKKPIPLTGSHPDQMEEEELRGNRLTQVHLENGH